MDRLMTTRSPASALLHPQGMIGAADENSIPGELLKMAFHAKVRVADAEHFGVNRAVSRVTNRASLA